MTSSQLFVLIPYFYITLKHTSLVTVYRIQIKFHVFVLFFMSTTKKLYIIPLHHSQTYNPSVITAVQLVYHTFLHHSQTSNSKIICHHLHIQNKVLKPPLINFTSIFIYNISHSPFYTNLFLIFNK